MKTSFFFLGFFLFAVTFSMAQVAGPTMARPVYFDISPPLCDIMKMPVRPDDNSLLAGNIKNRLNPRSSRLKQPLPENFMDPVRQTNPGLTVLTDTTIQNFDGNRNTQGYDPPDTHGDVGPNHYFQVVNCHYSIYSKTGNLLLGPLNTSSIWTGMPNNSNNGDGVVLYDDNANRWLVVQLSLPNGMTAPFYEMVAVSQTADPTGSWYRYEYTFSDLPDYEKLGVWPDGYYMSCNRFTSSSLNYAGTGQGVFNRAKMLTGDPTAEMVYFTLPSSDNAWALLPADCDGAFPPAGTPNFFTYFFDGPYYLGIYEFHVDWTNSSNSTFGNYLQLPVVPFNDAINGIPQKGTTKMADVLADRLMYRLQFRKFSDHWSMVCNHTVDATGTGIGGIRWYELRKSTGTWALRQQSTYSPDALSRWMGSVAMDTAGDIALGYSVSGSNMYPAIRYTGRMKNDILGTMTISEKGIYNGTGSNTAGDGVGGSGNCRWGDYSTMQSDPSAYGLFWYSQQYMLTNGTSWRTRIASFSFSNVLSVTASANPTSVTVPQSSQLGVIALGGSGNYSYSWSSIPAGFTSTMQYPLVAPFVATKYIVAVNDGTQTKTDTTQVTVLYTPLTITAIANPSQICSGQTSQLSATAGGGTMNYTWLWSSIPPGFTSNLQNPVVQPTLTTQYIAMVSDGILSTSDTTLVTVTPGPAAVAGNDTSFCIYVAEYPLHGIASGYSSVQWSTPGSGTFGDTLALNTTYFPSSADKMAGSVNLTLTANPLSPCNNSVSDTRHIIIDACLGVPEKENQPLGVTVEPNPTAGRFTLNLTGLNNLPATITLLDARGKQVFITKINPLSGDYHHALDFSSLSKGIYSVSVSREKEVKMVKVIIK